jgi:hypothetical protein
MINMDLKTYISPVLIPLGDNTIKAEPFPPFGEDLKAKETPQRAEQTTDTILILGRKS